MTQSEKFISLQKILSEDPAIKKVLKTASALASHYVDLGHKSVISTQDLQVLGAELNQLRIPAINAILTEIKVPNAIVAFPIHKIDQYTLFFVIVPPNKKFDWHSHPYMGGISKCFHGHLRISTIDIHLLQPYSYNTFLHPKNRLRLQSLKSSDKQTISIIEPVSYNVHKIEALELSAFFDLLVPDYPNNTCQFFTTIDENNENILLEQMASENEDILGWDTYLEQLLTSEKHIVKNYIIK